MERAIEGAKKLIETQVRGLQTDGNFAKFREFGKNYFWTNENIAGYLDLVDFEGKINALSVLASGDQAFNLVTNGIMDIDTFDINALSEYIALGLKRAAILRFNYDTFMNYMNMIEEGQMSLEMFTDMIKLLFPYMESKHKIFWQQILDYNYKLQKEHNTNFNLINLLCNQYTCVNHYNNFLNREKYDILRSKLANANISFKCANALNLPYEFRQQYDFVLLSNILDYYCGYWGFWEYDKLKEYEMLLESITKNSGVIFLHYIFMFYSDLTLFNGSNVYMSHLVDEELHLIPDDNNVVDAKVILKRVNHSLR